MMENDFNYFSNISVLYIETTNKCNLNCGYCYAAHTQERKQEFTFEMFKSVVDKIALYSNCEEISIIFHGGEPLLLPTSFYSECCEYAILKMNEFNKTVDFGLQSNLTLFSCELLPILEKYCVTVSTSIDGLQEIHDKARSKWSAVESNFRYLLDHGIKANFISVCSTHNKNDVEDIFKYAHSLNIKHIHINIASSPIALVPESKYLPLSDSEIYGVYEDIISNSLKYGIVEKNMETMVRRFLSEDYSNKYLTGHFCESPFCYAGSAMIVVTPNGQMFPCSPAVPLCKIGNDFALGNILENVSPEKYTDKLQSFHEKDAKYNEMCPSCEANIICDFGCPAFDRIDPITAKNKCLAVKRLFDKFKSMDANCLNRLLKI